MNEKPNSEEYEEDADDETVDSDDLQYERIFKDFDAQKRRGAPKGGEPAWRRLEKYLEKKHTAELLSDFEDYDIGDDEASASRSAPKAGARKKKAGR